jgi:hypothetical protein
LQDQRRPAQVLRQARQQSGSREGAASLGTAMISSRAYNRICQQTLNGVCTVFKRRLYVAHSVIPAKYQRNFNEASDVARNSRSLHS